MDSCLSFHGASSTSEYLHYMRVMFFGTFEVLGLGSLVVVIGRNELNDNSSITVITTLVK